MLNRNEDRCDRCGAEAFVGVEVGEVTLLFCGHHFARHEAAFAAKGYVVTDERQRINKKPSVSSLA